MDTPRPQELYAHFPEAFFENYFALNAFVRGVLISASRSKGSSRKAVRMRR